MGGSRRCAKSSTPSMPRSPRPFGGSRVHEPTRRSTIVTTAPPTSQATRTRVLSPQRWPEGEKVRGRPERCLSANPSRPSSKNRFRHADTVFTTPPTCTAITMFSSPSAAASTIRARCTSRCDAVRFRTTTSNRSRSTALNTITYGLGLDTTPPNSDTSAPAGCPFRYNQITPM